MRQSTRQPAARSDTGYSGSRYATATDGTFIVAATNGGADRSPGWLHNIEAHESIEAQIGRRRLRSLRSRDGRRRSKRSTWPSPSFRRTHW
ncbi:MAG: nitroreductase/quinone reductase family protein [Ilumatobacteraceae bacterium]